LEIEKVMVAGKFRNHGTAPIKKVVGDDDTIRLRYTCRKTAKWRILNHLFAALESLVSPFCRSF
jgi:hypothetical protein